MRSPLAGIAAVLGCSAPLLVASSALAVPVVLDWRTPPSASCPTAADVVAQVSALVSSRPGAGLSTVRANAVVARTADGRFRIDLTTEVDGRLGHRTLEERTCKAMAEATVLILAWMVDPTAAQSAQERESLPVDTVEVPAAADPPPSTPWQPVIGAEIAGDGGTLPSTVLGASLSAGVRHGVLTLAVRGSLFGSAEARLGAAPAGAAFSFWAAGVEACVSPFGAGARFGVAGCAGPELARISARGFGVDEPREGGVTWISATLGAEGRLGLLGPLELTARIGIVVPGRREQFGLDELGVVHRPAPVSGRAALGLRYVF